MQATRRKDTAPELAVRRVLHRRGLRYRVNATIPGIASLARRRMDIVFPRARTVVLVDGCFWHGCPLHATQAKANATFWRTKIEGNVRRDRDTDATLRDAGWTVLRAWEHEDPEKVADQVEQHVRLTGTSRAEH